MKYSTPSTGLGKNKPAAKAEVARRRAVSNQNPTRQPKAAPRK